MLTADSPSQTSNLTITSQQTQIDDLKTEVDKLHGMITKQLTKQDEASTKMETVIANGLDKLAQANQDKLTSLFTDWSTDLSNKIKEVCEGACVEQCNKYMESLSPGRKRKASASPTQPLEASDPDRMDDGTEAAT